MKIDITNLSIGLHELEFEESAEEVNLKNEEMFPNPIFSEVSIDKSETHIFVKAKVGSKAHFSCDRCLKEFERDVKGDFKLYFEMVQKGARDHLVDEENKNQKDDVRTFRLGQKEIDITDDVRDTLLLTIPMKVVCSEDCKGICPGCKKDLNKEECVCSEKPMDPRWEKLQALLDKNEKKD